jgi:hypothetical protein
MKIKRNKLLSLKNNYNYNLCKLMKSVQIYKYRILLEKMKNLKICQIGSIQSNNIFHLNNFLNLKKFVILLKKTLN